MEKQVRGDKIREIATIELFKKVMIDMLKGYPKYHYFGILEYFFGDEKIVNILEGDGFIQIEKKEGEQTKYRLSPEGIKLAISMVNLKYSEKMNTFTLTITILGALTLLLGLNHLFFSF